VSNCIIIFCGMNSMTGFGQDSGTLGDYSLRVEVHSVNQRGLMSQVNGPREWPALEVLVQQVIKDKFERGKFFLILRNEASGVAKSWEGLPVQSLCDKLDTYRKLAHQMGLPVDPSSEVFYRMIQETSENVTLPDWEEAKAEVVRILDGALGKLAIMRREEGERLKQDFVQRVEGLKSCLERIRIADGDRVQRYRNLLLARLEQMNLDLDVSDERMLKEVSLFADRCDISEEVARIESHLTALVDLFSKKKEGIGRQMEFILQEMHRETNTIGSKANDSDLSAIIIEVKQELEKMREQAANIE